MTRTRLTALVLLVFAGLAAYRLAMSAIAFNGELALRDAPLGRVPPIVDDPGTPRLARRVVLLIVDGLRLDHSHTPAFDELRRRGVAAVASAEYPTISRASYATILTGALPVAHGIRTNRVPYSTAVDSIMDRAQAAKLRVVSASDIGLLATLFLRGATERQAPASGIDYREDGDRVAPPEPLWWPFAEVRRARSVEAFGAAVSALVAGDGELVLLLAGDVDRAGHRAGVGEDYAAAAAAVGRPGALALAALDLERDTVIVTADHGHVDRGGHGGLEPEVVRVPLVLAGAGIARGSFAIQARLVDVAPTIAALLGLPAPGHASGRTLVEVLRLDREAARRRIAADLERAAKLEAATPEPPGKPDLARLLLALAGAVVAAVLARTLSTVRASKRSLAGGVAFACVMLALAVITHGTLSPSAVPPLARFQKLVGISAAIAILVQVAIAWRALPKQDRLAAANGFALAGLALSLVPVAVVRAWWSPPHYEVPGPEWFVGIPAVELAGAVGSAAVAAMLIVELVRGLQASKEDGRAAAVAGQPPARDR